MLRSADKSQLVSWPIANVFGGPPPTLLLDERVTGLISSFGPWSLGGGILSSRGGLAWPATNRALFVPFRVPCHVVVFQLACGTGTGTTGNFDLGIYDAAGARLVSSGSTAKTTASSERIVNTTDLALAPGLYYLAMATDGVTPYLQNSTPTNLGFCKLVGMRQMETAFPLPVTATFATMSTYAMPFIAAYLRAD